MVGTTPPLSVRLGATIRSEGMLENLKFPVDTMTTVGYSMRRNSEMSVELRPVPSITLRDECPAHVGTLDQGPRLGNVRLAGFLFSAPTAVIFSNNSSSLGA